MSNREQEKQEKEGKKELKAKRYRESGKGEGNPDSKGTPKKSYEPTIRSDRLFCCMSYCEFFFLFSSCEKPKNLSLETWPHVSAQISKCDVIIFTLFVASQPRVLNGQSLEPPLLME